MREKTAIHTFVTNTFMVNLFGNTNHNRPYEEWTGGGGRSFNHHKPHDENIAFAQCLVLDDKSSMINR